MHIYDMIPSRNHHLDLGAYSHFALVRFGQYLGRPHAHELHLLRCDLGKQGLLRALAMSSCTCVLMIGHLHL